MPNWTAHRPLVQVQFPNEQDTPIVRKKEHGWRLLHDDLLRRTTQSWPGLWPVEQEAQTVGLDAVARNGQARVQYYVARGRSIHFAGFSRQPSYRSNIHKACQCTARRIERILDGQPSSCTMRHRTLCPVESREGNATPSRYRHPPGRRPLGGILEDTSGNGSR
jgi:hypothetical protein